MTEAERRALEASAKMASAEKFKQVMDGIYEYIAAKFTELLEFSEEVGMKLHIISNA